VNIFPDSSVLVEQLTVNQFVPGSSPGRGAMKEPNEIFFEYFYHSYLYYKIHETEISDEEYDILCNDLLQVLDKVTHRCSRYLTGEDLVAGTGYFLSYPPDIERYIVKLHRQRYVDRTA
jgi:hypothetical protein